MNPIDALFTKLRAAGRRAFIPFLPAGDPDLLATDRLGRALADAGADILELGFPFSDPVADGPVIQASYARALDAGLKVGGLFAALRHLSSGPAAVTTPLVGMASFSLIHRRKQSLFLEAARESGLRGLIVPDLPAEEADELARAAADAGLALILLVTPTTPPKRAERIAKLSTGFLYVVSVSGITGERDRLPEALSERLRWLRGVTDLPLCVGFGVSRPDHAAALRESADGVIVGSALARFLEGAKGRGLDAVAADMTRLARGIVEALNPPE